VRLAKIVNMAASNENIAAGNKGDSPYRLFIAVEIPSGAVQQLLQWQELYLASDRALRMTPAGQLHVTLAFLGQMGEKGLEIAGDQLDRIEDRSSFAMTATHLVGLPKGRLPRVIAAGFDDPLVRIGELHDQLVEGLVAKRLYKKEKRPYFPHVTIARSRGKPRVRPVEITPEPIQFTAVRVTLYNSILKQSGAEHRPLKSVQLT
jgi:2'-5' RNA ligase